MEVYPRGSITLDQISLKNYSSCELDMKKREHSVAHRTSPTSREVVVRPEPRRIVKTGYIFNNLDRFCCTSRKSIILPTHEKDSRLDFINRLLGKDDLEDEIDDDSRDQMGLFCGSPPVRTNNPLIHDIQFLQQAPILVSSPLEESHGAKGSSSRVERVSAAACGTSNFGGKPLVRIEGFSCGSSKSSRCFVPAFA